MVVWVIAVSLAGMFFVKGEDIVFSLFSGPLSHDTFGLVRQIAGIMAFCAQHFLPLLILALTYNIRNRRMMRLQARVTGFPAVPGAGAEWSSVRQLMAFSFGIISGVVLFAAARKA